MFRLLGLLSLGNLLFGGRHHHRALRRGLLFGALLGYLARKDFDTEQAEEDFRKAARKVKRTVHETARAVRKELRNARKAEHDRRAAEYLNHVHADMDARKAEREVRNTGRTQEIRALPECDTREAKAIRELAEDLERNARTFAMAADVPTIQFPEEDEKYHSAGKYGYA